MDVPSVSTDNLYKFLTTGGLALAIAAYVVNFQQSEKLREQRFSLEMETVRANLEVGRWKDQQSLLQKHRDSIKARGLLAASRFNDFIDAVAVIPDEQKAKRRNEMATILEQGNIWGQTELRALTEQTYKDAATELPARDKQFFDDMEREVPELLAKEKEHFVLAASADDLRAGVEVRDAQLTELEEFQESLTRKCSWLFGIGLGIAAVGFAYWFFAFQSKQDRLLKAQLAEAEKKVIAK